MKNKTALIFLVTFCLAFISLISLSAYYNNQLIKEGKEKRKNIDILARIIEKTENRHPVFNQSIVGKTIVINVWASWCQPCWKEMPELNQLHKAHSGDEVVFIALNSLKKASEEKQFEKRNTNFNYRLIYEQESLIKFLYSFKLDQEKQALPPNIILDKNGKAAFYYTGYHPNKIKAMDQYLKNI